NDKYKWEGIDKNGNIVIEPIFDYIWSFRKGYAPFLLNNKWGVIDTTGRIIIEPKYDRIEW
ncbi:MAG: WG repeat-containing protein, partial [Bacteroidales bacterium]|nr:WG repeat-containing protein [Bacteroidales bacterium]